MASQLAAALPPFFTDVDGAFDKITGLIAPLGLDTFTRTTAVDLLGKDTVKSVESYFNSEGHPMVLSAKLPWFNVWSVIAIVSAYLSTLLVLRILGFILPASLGRSKPFKLVQVVHNLILIGTSFWCAFNCYIQMQAGGYWWLLNDVHTDITGKRVFHLLYLCWLLRIYEFVDTFLILLKQSWRQASFLHIYHHASVLAYIFFGVWCAPNGDTVFPCFLNSCVHVVMYTYFLASTVGLRMPFKYSITIMQLLQFVWITVNFGARVVTQKPNYSQTAAIVSIAYMGTMLILFMNFLIKGLKGQNPESPRTPPKKQLKAGQPVKGGKPAAKGAKRE